MAKSSDDKKLQEWLSKSFPIEKGKKAELEKESRKEEMDEGELSSVLQALGANRSTGDEEKVKNILAELENSSEDPNDLKEKRIKLKQKAFLERIIKDDNELSWLREEYPDLQNGDKPKKLDDKIDESKKDPDLKKSKKSSKAKKTSSKKNKELTKSEEVAALELALSEMSIEDPDEASAPYSEKRISKKKYRKALIKMQKELVHLQNWVEKTGKRVVIVFEGRDASGKGGTIKRITEFLNPRVVRIEALAKPTEKERTQWYFQRYVDRLPAAGEIVLFDRSWYNRAGVEPVMGFCSEQDRDSFLKASPIFESMLLDDGIILIKYWFEINHEIQKRRLLSRVEDPSRQWKIGYVDQFALEKFSSYTKARDLMILKTHTEQSPWNIVKANVKRHARLNCINHLLKSIPYEKISPTADELAIRPLVIDPDYQSPASIKEAYVKEKYKA